MGSKDRLYPSVVLFSVSSCFIADIQSVFLDWLLLVCPLYYPNYTDLAKRLHIDKKTFIK